MDRGETEEEEGDDEDETSKMHAEEKGRGRSTSLSSVMRVGMDGKVASLEVADARTELVRSVVLGMGGSFGVEWSLESRSKRKGEPASVTVEMR
jgi:hypothetical protein